MEVYYRREMRHNYLVIVPECLPQNEYESQMLARNTIHGLLKFRIGQPDGECCFYYEITSKQPLSRLLEAKGMTGRELSQLILSIAGTLEKMEPYLLSEEQILLQPDYIYVEPESFQLFFGLVPGSRQDFPAAVEGLLQYLLGCIDHQDKECVVLAYGLYQESQKENFGIRDLLQLLSVGTSGEAAAYEQKEPVQRFDRPIPKEDSSETEYLMASESPANVNWKARLTQAVGLFSGVRDENKGKPEMSHEKKQKKRSETRQETKPEKRQETAVWDEWQELLEEDKPVAAIKEPLGETMTELLTDLETKSRKFCLRPLQPGLTDIWLDSFPFIIGKDSNLVDYHLEKTTVSRLHVRIDCSQDGYQIKDLNSTNGTWIRGRMLENNEQEELNIGDEIQIAEYKYRFEQV